MGHSPNLKPSKLNPSLPNYVYFIWVLAYSKMRCMPPMNVICTFKNVNCRLTNHSYKEVKLLNIKYTLQQSNMEEISGKRMF
jgi:hypothetical protein